MSIEMELIAKHNDIVLESLTGINPGTFCEGCEDSHRTHDYVEVNGGRKVYCKAALKDAEFHGVVAKCEWCDKLWETEEMTVKGDEYDGDAVCTECK